MIWKPLIDIAHLLCWIVLVWMFLRKVSNRRTAMVPSAGRIEFTRNRLAFFAWPVITVLLTLTAIRDLTHSHGEPLELVIAACLGFIALLFLLSFPGTLVVNDVGLEQVYWFWRHKRILWKDIVEINIGGKSRTVTITSTDGTKIIHSSQLADRPRLLLELKQRCSENLPPDFPREPIVGL
jgi:Bacterial PH domain